MKYIRTKDGKIIDLESWQYDKYNKCYFNKKYRLQDNVYQNLIYKQDIVKQADTIEELCDQFVLLDGNKVFQIANNRFSTIKDIWQLNKETYVYGAIWTDKGLIYVAKMNEKGELELL